jgi:hypothetical protein
VTEETVVVPISWDSGVCHSLAWEMFFILSVFRHVMEWLWSCSIVVTEWPCLILGFCGALCGQQDTQGFECQACSQGLGCFLFSVRIFTKGVVIRLAQSGQT